MIWKNVRPRLWLWWHMLHSTSMGLADEKYWWCSCGSVLRRQS